MKPLLRLKLTLAVIIPLLIIQLEIAGRIVRGFGQVGAHVRQLAVQVHRHADFILIPRRKMGDVVVWPMKGILRAKLAI